MSKAKILLTRPIFPDILATISEFCEIQQWSQDKPAAHEWIVEHIPDAEGLICMLNDRIDADLISRAPIGRLKVISQMAVGVDNIDLHAATSAAIPVGHTPGVLTETTADFAWALIMSAARRIGEGQESVKQGVWPPWGPQVFCGMDVYGKTLGLIGFGRIGQAMARRAVGFNMNVIYYEPRKKPENASIPNAHYVSLEKLLKESDFVSLHAYLSGSSQKMIGAAQLSMMKPTAILINTARGAMIDQDALYEALTAHKIAAAALDVFDPEPMPQHHPLLHLPNVIVTPHIASASTATRRKMAELALENLRAGLQGSRLPHCANPEVYTR